MGNLIIRKKRSWFRKLLENTFVYGMWLIVIIILISIIFFLCNIDIDNFVTMYLLLNISAKEFQSYFEMFSWLISFIFIIGFFVQMHHGMMKEYKHEEIKK